MVRVLRTFLAVSISLRLSPDPSLALTNSFPPPANLGAPGIPYGVIAPSQTRIMMCGADVREGVWKEMFKFSERRSRYVVPYRRFFTFFFFRILIG